MKVKPGCLQSLEPDALFVAKTAEDWQAAVHLALSSNSDETIGHPVADHDIPPDIRMRYHSYLIAGTSQHEERHLLWLTSIL